MPDELRESRPEERRLEREEAAEPVERRLDLRDATLLPRPDLGTDHVHRPDPPPLRIRRKLQVHPRIIDRADHIGLPLVNRPLHRPLHPEEVEDPPQDLSKPHHREIAGPEAVVPVAADLHRGPLLAKCLRNPLGVHHARFLPG